MTSATASDSVPPIGNEDETDDSIDYCLLSIDYLFFGVSVHQVRAVCAECTEVYGRTVYCISTQGKRFSCTGKGNQAQARYGGKQDAEK